VQVVGAAPLTILSKLTRIGLQSGKGIVANLRHGPTIYFGDAADLDAKWADAMAILADPSSRGATYIDVRIANRPVAGGLQVPVVPQAGAATQAPTLQGPSQTGAVPTTSATPQTTTPPQSASPQSATPQTATPQSATPQPQGPSGP
jgi:hypothetical protein